MKEFLLVDAPHPSTIDEELLLRHCKLEFGRGTGPGGQRPQQSRHRLRDRARTNGVMAHAAEMQNRPTTAGWRCVDCGIARPRGTHLCSPRALSTQ